MTRTEEKIEVNNSKVVFISEEMPPVNPELILKCGYKTDWKVTNTVLEPDCTISISFKCCCIQKSDG